MKLQLTINEQQAVLMRDALDLMGRLLMGQVESLEGVFRFMSLLEPKSMYDQMDLEEMSALICKLKEAVYPQHPVHGSPSLTNPEVNDRARVLFDLHNVIEHALYDPEKDPLKMHRGAYPPTKFSTECPLAEAMKIEDPENPIALSPVDWTHNFTQYDWEHGGATNPECVKESKEFLKILEEGLAAGKKFEATTDGGSPRCGWQEVVDVGMGRHKPVVITVGQFSTRLTNSFLQIRDVREVK